MDEQYVSDTEYNGYYARLCNLRDKIAADLPVRRNMRILDLATGSGYFAIALSQRENSTRIYGIDISVSSAQEAKLHIARGNLDERISILQADASKMCFSDGTFDLVANFTGLEDIHMTRGLPGVEKTFSEVSRVLRSNGYFCFAAMPPDEMETPAQKIEVDLFSFICGATWLDSAQYLQFLEENGMILLDKKIYEIGKKLTPEQAKEEIKYSCEYAPKLYGVKALSFEETWARYGPDIEKHGLAHYSKVILMISRKENIKH
jgi:ubiquinone/menaquinone biosynthesis C-methylase UbiE